MANAQETSSASGPIEDTGMRCEKCGYNLTGLTENRCPECGNSFAAATSFQHTRDTRFYALALVAINLLAIASAYVMWFVPADMSDAGGFMWVMPPIALFRRTLLLLFQFVLGQGAWTLGRRLRPGHVRLAWLIIGRTFPFLLALTTIGVICSRVWGI